MVFGFLIFIHVIVCAALIGIVLLQSGKGGGLAGLGGGSTQAVFGGRGATDVLSKITEGLAIAFMVMSFALAIYGSRTGDTPSSIIDARRAEIASPAATAIEEFQAAQESQTAPALGDEGPAESNE
jgi:preprotein translocase subunit SecG